MSVGPLSHKLVNRPLVAIKRLLL